MSALRKVFVICWILFYAGFISSHQHFVNPSGSPYDVIVIGAGAAGVSALTRLHRAGLKVLGLEAENTIGGRIMTQYYGSGVVELGAEWIHGHNTVYKLAKEAEVPVIERDDLNFNFLLADGSRLPVKEARETTFEVYKALTSVRREPFEKYFNLTYEAYMSSSPGLTPYRPILDSIVDWCKKYAYTDYPSGNWNLFSTKGWTNVDIVNGPRALSWHTSTGYHSLFDALINVTLVNIKLNKEVVHVNWVPDTESNLVTVQCADGSVYKASTVIVTVSLGVLQATHEAMFTPPLPASTVQSINILNLGAVIKMALRYETKWWGDETNLAFIWDEKSRSTLSESDGWLEDLFGAMTATGSDNVLVLWLTGEIVWFVETIPVHILKMKLDWLVRKFCKPHFSHYQDSVELRRCAALHKIALYYELRTILCPISHPTNSAGDNLISLTKGTVYMNVDIAHVSTWLTNPHFRGSYTYHGVRSDIINDPTEGLREPVVYSEELRLLFSGEATSQHHFCSVHGAVESGWREADRILATKFQSK